MPCIWSAARIQESNSMAKRFAIGLLALLAWLCAAFNAPVWAAEKLAVFADIGPVASLGRAVGGERVQVSLLVPPGRDPHTFEPTPRQMAGLASARLFLNLDLPFARRLLPKLQSANPALKVVDVAAGIKRIPLDSGNGGHGDDKDHGHAQGELDPHLWLDPNRAAIIAANAAEAFSQADPAGREYYQANLKRTQARLMELDAKLRQILAPYKGREFFVFHPALGYLAQAYGLKQVAVQAGGKEPGAKRLAWLIRRAKEKQVRIIFVEPQFPRGTAQTLAQAIGGAVVALDPLSPEYPANLETMAHELARALKQVKP
jgi:zinc transport system substrate-binding protein